METVVRSGGTAPIIRRSLLALGTAVAAGAVAGVVVGVLYAVAARPTYEWWDLIAVLMGILTAGLVTLLTFWGLMVPLVRRTAPPGRRLAVLGIVAVLVLGVPVLAAGVLAALPWVVGGEVNSGVMLSVLVTGILAPPVVLALREGRAAPPQGPVGAGEGPHQV